MLPRSQSEIRIEGVPLVDKLSPSGDVIVSVPWLQVGGAGCSLGGLCVRVSVSVNVRIRMRVACMLDGDGQGWALCGEANSRHNALQVGAFRWPSRLGNSCRLPAVGALAWRGAPPFPPLHQPAAGRQARADGRLCCRLPTPDDALPPWCAHPCPTRRRHMLQEGGSERASGFVDEVLLISGLTESTALIVMDS